MHHSITFAVDRERLTINLWEPAPQPTPFPALSFSIDNAELAKLAEHVLGLASKPKAAPKPKAKGVVAPSHFDAFWDLYPHTRRVARAQMQVKWAANNLDAEWPLIERHLQASMPGWAKDQYKYCPLATTYINQRRWEAIAEEVQPTIV